MKAVAEAAGVSQQAVSQAINETGRLTPQTRARVLSVARQMGYRVNTSAKSMRSGRFDCLALMLSEHPHTSTLPEGMLRGIQQGLEQRDMTLKLGRLPDAKLTREGYVPKLLREWSVDGMLFNYTDHIPPRLMEIVRDCRVPSLWLNARLDEDCVYHDDHAAARLATEHLLELGHRRILYIDFAHERDRLEDTHYSATDRWGGYRDAMRAAGLEPAAIWQEDQPPGEDRARAFAGLLGSSDRPTAVVAYASALVRTLRMAACYAGLDVPGDLSMVGVDDRIDRSLGDQPTTAVLDVLGLGRLAVERMLEKIDQPDRVLPPLAVAPSFIPGTSTAPPPVAGPSSAS